VGIAVALLSAVALAGGLFLTSLVRSYAPAARRAAAPFLVLGVFWLMCLVAAGAYVAVSWGVLETRVATALLLGCQVFVAAAMCLVIGHSAVRHAAALPHGAVACSTATTEPAGRTPVCPACLRPVTVREGRHCERGHLSHPGCIGPGGRCLACASL